MSFDTMYFDLDGHEAAHLRDLANFTPSMRVLEIGCGDGRLVRKYAHLVASVIGIDPLLPSLSYAMNHYLIPPRGKVTMVQAIGEELPFAPETFAMVIFGRSLGWIKTLDGKVQALKDVWRVLAPDGIMFDSRQTPSDSRIEVLTGDQAIRAGDLPDAHWAEIEAPCQTALEEIVRDGWFAEERKVFFGSGWRFDMLDRNTVDRLKDIDIVEMRVTDTILARVKELMDANPGARVRWTTKTHIGKYRKLPR